MQFRQHSISALKAGQDCRVAVLQYCRDAGGAGAQGRSGAVLECAVTGDRKDVGISSNSFTLYVTTPFCNARNFPFFIPIPRRTVLQREHFESMYDSTSLPSSGLIWVDCRGGGAVVVVQL